MSHFPLIILLTVLFLIAIRQLLPLKLAIWQIMAAGALAVLFHESITLKAAFIAINWDIIGFLFGVFVIAQGLEQSNALDNLLMRSFGKIKSGFKLLFYFILVSAVGSAILMNDAVAIMGVPVIILLTKKNPQLKWPLFFALAFSVTIGSNLSPIGNPQNLLIATSHLEHPFWIFAKSLWLPSIINLLIAFGYLSFIFRKALKQPLNLNNTQDNINTRKALKQPLNLNNTQDNINTRKALKQPLILNNTQDNFNIRSDDDMKLAKLSKISCSILILFILSKIILDGLHLGKYLPFSLLSTLACLPIIIRSNQRFSLIKQIDWGTLIFFISLFILIACVWQSGVLQTEVTHYIKYLLNMPALMGVSLVGSQIVSNVPLVALYMPILEAHHAGLSMYLALAASSTIAGNLSIMGAASNVIILQKFEKLENFSLGFGRFFITGLPLVLVNLLVYWAFLVF